MCLRRPFGVRGGENAGAPKIFREANGASEPDRIHAGRENDRETEPDDHPAAAFHVPETRKHRPAVATQAPSSRGTMSKCLP